VSVLAFCTRVARLGVLPVLAALMAAAPAPALGAFPGTNGRIAYDDVGNIYSVNPDGSGFAQLTTFPDGGWGPEWSPDGQRIVFMSDRGGLGGQVYVMNADGSAQTRLTAPPAQAGQPAWSADGRRIVFTRGGDLWLMDADGSNEAPLTSLLGDEFGPDWSPDGSRIAFTSNGQIWSISPDGSDLRQITEPPAYPVTGTGAPDWSPDGSQLVYLEASDADGEFCMSIHTVRADGSGRTQVRPATCESGVFGNFYAAPSWSPDGARIASGDGFVLFTVRVDGSDYMELPGHPAYLTDWQPVPGPAREDYPNASQFCKAELQFLGPEAFIQKYGSVKACKRDNR
jgi:TolB protein